MSDLEDNCLWKLTPSDLTTPALRDIREGHKLWGCVVGDGKKYCCPNHSGYEETKRKQTEDHYERS